MGFAVDFFSSWISYFWLTFIRPFVKGFLRRTTGLCELQRICYATRGSSSERSLQIEQSISLSRSTVVQRVKCRIIYDPKSEKKSGKQLDTLSNEVIDDENLLVNFAVEAICLEKNIKAKIHQEFVTGLKYTLTQLYQFKKVIEETLILTRTPYDKEKSDHIELLLVSIINCPSVTCISTLCLMVSLSFFSLI